MLSNQEIAKVKKYLGARDEDLAEIFKVLSEPNRCKMFRAVAKYKKLSVSDAARIVEVSLPLASQHLKVLLNGDLLTKVKEGQTVFYSLNHKNKIVESILNAIE